MRNQHLYESRYRKALKPILQAQRKEALYNLEAHASGLTKDLQSSLFDASKYNKDFIDGLMPVLTDLADTQGALALVFAGDDQSEFRLTANILAHMRSSTEKMAKKFNQETLDKLSASLSEGIAQGESLDTLAFRVADIYDGAEHYRADRLARTETLSASNNATNWAYKQTGYVKAKEWYTNPGACPICDAFNGKVVGLDDTYATLGQNVDYTDEQGNQQTYAVDYADIENPPIHPNCRCTIVPVR